MKTHCQPQYMDPKFSWNRSQRRAAIMWERIGNETLPRRHLPSFPVSQCLLCSSHRERWPVCGFVCLILGLRAHHFYHWLPSSWLPVLSALFTFETAGGMVCEPLGCVSKLILVPEVSLPGLLVHSWTHYLTWNDWKFIYQVALALKTERKALHFPPHSLT